jgi:hypothetical protein
MNKKSKSKNILTCNVTGQDRMSNKEYLANKAAKKGTTVEEFKQFYICKEQYKALKSFVSEEGIDAAAYKYDVDRDIIKSWLSMNGRGTYSIPKATEVVASKDWKGVESEELVTEQV